MSQRDAESEALRALSDALGHRFTDEALLRRALTHTSYVNEQSLDAGGSAHLDNERLEFLGDAVLQLAVSEWLFERFPEVSEGALTQRRAAIVNSDALAEVGQRLKLGELLRVGVGEERSGGRTRSSNLADAMEALLGALFLDAGFLVASSAVRRVFAARVEAVMRRPAKGPKSRLQEHVQAHHHMTPSYTLVEMSGPAHAARFLSEVRVAGVVSARGAGASKKEAEKEAARHALTVLGVD